MDASQEVCAICLDSIKEAKAILEECRHTFCKTCIDKWTDIRLKCPVCNQELKSLSLKKNHSQVQTVDSSEEQFECLDHNYFATQFLILQMKLNDTKFLLKKDFKLSRYNNAWDALELIEFEITQKLKVLADIGKICPKSCLADVYRIDLCLRDIGSGNYKGMNLLKSETIKQSDEKTRDYYYDQNEEEYYEEGDENYYYNNEDSEYDTYFSCITSVELKKKPKNKKKNHKKNNTTGVHSQARIKL